MKNKVFLLCIILLLSSIAFGQGTWTQVEGPSSAHLFGCCFTNADTGWACGPEGIIWKTTNGGNSWTDISYGYGRYLRKIWAFNKNDIIIVGGKDGGDHDGYILKSNDGGETWSDSIYAETREFRDIAFNDSVGYIVGIDDDVNNGLIYYSSDYGETWMPYDTVDSYFFNSVQILNDSILWMAQCPIRVCKYNTVTKQETIFELPNAISSTYTVYFANSDTGWAGGYSGYLAKTINGGQNWSDTTLGSGNDVMDIYFISENLGFLGANYGELYKNTTGSLTGWSLEEDFTTNSHIYDLDFVNAGTGWLAGINGLIAKYTHPDYVPEISVSTYSINFGNIYFGNSDSSVFNISNSGINPLNIYNITSDNEDFTLSDSTARLFEDEYAYITLYYNPSDIGNDTSSILITSNDTDEDSIIITAYGTVINPEISLNSSSLDIGDVPIDYCDSNSIILKNEGTSDLVISDITSNNDKFTINNTSFTISGGDSQSVYVNFSPVTLGEDSSVITIISNDFDEDSLSFTAFGNGTNLKVIVSCPDTTVARGNTVYIPISLSDVQSIDSIFSFQFKIGYNNSLIEYMEYDTTGTLGSDFSVNYNESYSDTIVFSGASDNLPILENGILLKLGFNIKSSFAFYDTADIIFKSFIFNEGSPEDSTLNGSITIDSCIYGDVSLNGEITAYDASLILLYTVEDTSLSNAAEIAADVSDNGSVSALDASYILRYVVGVISEFPVGDEKFVPKTDLSQAELSVDYEYGDDGTVECLLILNNAKDVFSSELDINFSNMELLAVEKAEAAKEYQIAQKNTGDNLKIAIAGVEPLKTGSEIIRLKFRLLNGEPSFRLSKAVLNETGISVTGIDDKIIPRTFNLSQNYPNPFNPETTIKYELPEAANVIMKIYNMLGQEVKTLVNSRQKAGYYNIKWNGTNNLGFKVSSGVYIYRIKAGKFIRSMKMVYMR